MWCGVEFSWNFVAFFSWWVCVLVNRDEKVTEGFNGINSVDQEESKVKFKQKKLLNELLELQKDFVSKKRKLQAAKLRKENILGEILYDSHTCMLAEGVSEIISLSL